MMSAIYDREEYELERGQVAYEAYREVTGGKSLATGLPIPTWEQLPPAIKNAWCASAAAVCARFGAIY